MTKVALASASNINDFVPFLNSFDNELNGVVGDGRFVDENDIFQLKYLLIVKETFCLHPSTPLLVQHESIESCEVNDVLESLAFLIERLFAEISFSKQ